MYVRVFFIDSFFSSLMEVFFLFFCLVLLPPTYLSLSAVFRLFVFFDFVLFFFAISLFFLPSQLRVSNDCFTLSYSCLSRESIALCQLICPIGLFFGLLSEWLVVFLCCLVGMVAPYSSASTGRISGRNIGHV